MKRKVDMIEDEISRVRDELEEESYGICQYEPEYDVLMGKIDVCDQFLVFIRSLNKSN